MRHRRLFSRGLLAIWATPLLTVGAWTQTNDGSPKSTQSDGTQQKARTTKNSKKKGTDQKKSGASDKPMDEKPPVRSPGRPETPTLPPQTPGQQPVPQHTDPKSPTAAPQQG